MRKELDLQRQIIENIENDENYILSKEYLNDNFINGES